MALIHQTHGPSPRNQMDHWTVRTRTLVPWSQIERVLPRHLEHEKNLAARGILLLAGPFVADGGGFTGEGFAVYSAASEDEALNLAREDPFVSEGLREVTAVERWSIRRVGARVGELRSEDEQGISS